MTEVELHYLDSLLDCENGLTPWELDFIESLDENFRERNLSEKQADRLEAIYDMLCLGDTA